MVAPATAATATNCAVSARRSPAGRTFADRVKALLRRHVVERCIYGVDINPLAVELARVSLWVETLDPELPFSFLDHKIKVGNSLVGCWLDRVEDYPLKAWEREGGDGKNGPRTQRIEEFLKGREDRQHAHRRRADQEGDAGGHREPVQQAAAAVSREQDHHRSGRGPGPQRVREAAQPADCRPRRTGTVLSGACRRPVQRCDAEAGDGRVVCRLVLAHR